jgi:hypothetical protein
MLCLGVSPSFCAITSQTPNSGYRWIGGKSIANVSEGIGFLPCQLVFIGLPLLLFFGFLNAVELLVGSSMAPTVLVAALTLLYYYKCHCDNCTASSRKKKIA